MDNKITAWIGIISSIVTVGLTVTNGVLKARVDDAEVRIKESEQSIKEKEHELNVTKERMEQYKFVLSVLTGIEAKTETDRTIAMNICRLALGPAESETLFSGLATSKNSTLKDVGKEGLLANERQKKADPTRASQLERQAFEALLSKDSDKAASLFEEAEAAYPTYHQVYELGRFIRANKQRLDDPSKRKDALKEILLKYSWGAPRDLLAKLEQETQ